MSGSKKWLFALITMLAALIVQVGTWFVLYPRAGYNKYTLLIAQAVFLALGIGLMFIFRIEWRRIGVGGGELIKAVGGMLISYGLLLVILLIQKALNVPVALFREQYQLYSFVDNWVLTGFGEELVFAGILFNLIKHSLKQRKPWIAILLTASMFALWHLPAYLAIGLRTGNLGSHLFFDLLLNMISWGFFGMIYYLSGNLWFTSFAHASTDFALLPAITTSPLIGLVFMGINLMIAKRLGGKRLSVSRI